jgi:hypothetical protein
MPHTLLLATPIWGYATTNLSWSFEARWRAGASNAKQTITNNGRAGSETSQLKKGSGWSAARLLGVADDRLRDPGKANRTSSCRYAKLMISPALPEPDTRLIEPLVRIRAESR